MASCEAVRRTSSHGVPSANWSEMAPMRPVWMLHDSVMADRIGPDQYEVCELIGIGRMCRLWLPRQSPATMGAVERLLVAWMGAGLDGLGLGVEIDDLEQVAALHLRGGDDEAAVEARQQVGAGGEVVERHRFGLVGEREEHR